jgi:hypothetical protein
MQIAHQGAVAIEPHESVRAMPAINLRIELSTKYAVVDGFCAEIIHDERGRHEIPGIVLRAGPRSENPTDKSGETQLMFPEWPNLQVVVATISRYTLTVSLIPIGY